MCDSYILQCETIEIIQYLILRVNSAIIITYNKEIVLIVPITTIHTPARIYQRLYAENAGELALNSSVGQRGCRDLTVPFRFNEREETPLLYHG